jgi:hypothetical protein
MKHFAHSWRAMIESQRGQVGWSSLIHAMIEPQVCCSLFDAYAKTLTLPSPEAGGEQSQETRR